MSPHTTHLLMWCAGMAAAVALAINDCTGLAFFALLICACLRSTGE